MAMKSLLSIKTLSKPGARPSFIHFTGPFARLFRHAADRPVFDQDEVNEARAWNKSAHISMLPKGNTHYSRSSGPGGQHVNKTESKATTVWPLGSLLPCIPKILHQSIRESRYYTKGSDSLSIQSQTSRSRDANAQENRTKMFEEIQRIYSATVPGEVSREAVEKHEEQEKTFHRARVAAKKHHSAKKASRRGPRD